MYPGWLTEEELEEDAREERKSLVHLAFGFVLLTLLRACGIGG